MAQKKTANRGMAVLLSAALVPTVGVPAAAFADEAADMQASAALQRSNVVDDMLAGQSEQPVEDAVATVNGQSYATLAEAIAAAKNGGVVEVQRNLTADQVTSDSQNPYILIADQGANVTIDLNKHSIQLNAADTIAVQASDVTLKIIDGSIENVAANGYGLYVYNNKATGAGYDNVNVVFEDVTLTTKDQAIGVQGLNSDNNVTLKNCVINASKSLGAYWPPKSGVLTLDGTTINAGTGLMVKGGQIKVLGDTVINADGDRVIPEDYYNGDPNKSIVLTGDAVYMQSGYNDREIAIDIESGVFNSENNLAVRYFAKTNEAAPERKYNITGGSFSSELSVEYIGAGAAMLVNEDGRAAVMAEAEAEKQAGAYVEKDGKKVYYTSEKAAQDANPGNAEAIVSYCVQVGEAKYGSLSEAVVAAHDGDTAQLTDNVEMTKIAVVEGKKLTLDLNGKTVVNTTNIWSDEPGKKAWSLVSLRNGAELVVEGDGTMKAKKDDCYVFDIQNGSKLTVNDGTFVGNVSVAYLLGKSDLVVNGGDFSLQQLDNRKDYQFMLNCLDKDYKSGDAVVTVNGGVFHGFNPGANAAESGDMSTSFLGEGAAVTADEQTVPPTYTVAPEYVPPVTPPTDPEPQPDVDVEQRPDGSTVTTETRPDGSQTVTTEAADGSQSVVSKDAEGNVTSVEVAVSDKAAAAGEVVLPIEPASPAASAGEAPAIEVDMPASAAGKPPVKVTVPVGADAPDYGVVVYAVDADGDEVLLPKCGVDAEGNVVFEAEGDVTVKVVDASPSFPDVEGAWYGSDGTADFVGARGVLAGMPQADGTLLFDGDAPTTRAMFVTMLHRLESEPAAGAEGFEDVDGDWFAGAAAWGAQSGVVNGYGDGSVFGGNDPVTREQMAVFAMRYAAWLGLDTSARADLSAFADGAQASGYASEALSWAVAEGVIKGHADGSGRLDPRGGATRAEASAVVMRLVNGMYA